jgi:predicted nucleic acid-binding protein
MILVDTSVWVTHLKKGSSRLQHLLHDVEVASHPMVIGELACGTLHNRSGILAMLETLPQVTVAEHTEVLQLIEKKRLMGTGIGYVDAHLLASAILSHTPLWTEDNHLKKIATSLKIVY